MPILKGKFFFHQISKEKSAAYYIRARAIVGQIRYAKLTKIILNYHQKCLFGVYIVNFKQLLSCRKEI